MVPDSPTRRALLASVGGGMAAAKTGVALAAESHDVASHGEGHVISINSPSDVPVEYTFTTSGPVEKSTYVPPGLPHGEATIDSDDVISGRTVSGLTQGGVDSYEYMGEITSFSATNCAEANVWVDDARIDACQYPEAGASPTEHVISVNSPSDERVYYAFEVAGSVEKSSAVPPGVPHDRATLDPADEVDGRAVRGFTQGGVDTYVYDELMAFTITSGSCTEANVWIDEEPIDACALDRRLPSPDGSGGGGATGITSSTVIDEPGSYVVGSDFSSTGFGVRIAADDVTLDCDDHCIEGDGQSDSVGIRVEGDGATIRNACLENWGTCIEIVGNGADVVDSSVNNFGSRGEVALLLNGTSGSRVEGCSVGGIEVAISMEGTTDCLIQDIDAGTAGSEGLTVRDSTGDTFVGNRISGITFAAIVGHAEDAEFRDNVFDGGDEDGLVVYDSSGIELIDNVASGNAYSGMRFSFVGECAVRRNELNDNGDAGVIFDLARNSQIIENQIRGNCYSSDRHGGITLSDADDNEVLRNTLCNDDAPEEVRVDGSSSGNVIRDNDTC